MSHLCSLPPAALLAVLLAGSGAQAGERPQLLPARDVDISYDVIRAQGSRIRQRVRWLAAEHLERIDGPGTTATIFDHGANLITLLSPSGRSYRKLEEAPRQAFEPPAGAALKEGRDALIAGLHCLDWSWTEDYETHTVCLTPDGVLLRLVVDGQTVMEARSVSFAQQKAELFEVPPDYAPALAPDGGAQP